MLTASSLDAHSPCPTRLPAAPAFPVIKDPPPSLTKAFLWDSGVGLPIRPVHWFTVSEGSWDRSTGGGMHFEGQGDVSMRKVWQEGPLGGRGREQSLGIKGVGPA